MIYETMVLKGLNSGATFTVLKKKEEQVLFCNYKKRTGLFSFVR